MSSEAAFYAQPGGRRFSDWLSAEVKKPQWEVLEIGVAWVRRSGTRLIRRPLRRFLRRSGIVRVTVGIDIENTSYEGLRDLLTLQRSGVAEIYVYHNESPSSTFHPKVYLFYGGQQAKLVVGSHNLTEGGLYVNTEAAVEYSGRLSDDIVVSARAALATWRDTSQRLSRPLTKDLLADLLREGYVMRERSLQRRRARQVREGGGKARKALFGRQAVSRPSSEVRRGRRQRMPRGGVGRVLLMRVRKASPTERPTQTQVPKKVYEDTFFQGIGSIRSGHDGRSHTVRKAVARGIVNTLKLEIPEMRDYADPVIRFESGPNGIVYWAYDSASELGRPIMEALEQGRRASPATTRLTKRSDPDSSTWWRFI